MGDEATPIWKRIKQARDDLEGERPDGTFRRHEIIDHVNDNSRGEEPVKESSLGPMIQAVTVNAPGGAPGGLDKNLLYRVSRGVYKRYDPELDTVDLKQTLRLPPYGVLGEDSKDDPPFGRVDRRGAVVIPGEVQQLLGIRPGSIVAFTETGEGDVVLKRARLKLVTE